jgi:hypothetical protein
MATAPKGVAQQLRFALTLLSDGLLPASPLADCRPDVLFLAVKQVSHLRDVRLIRRGGRHRVHQAAVGVHADMRLLAEEPFARPYEPGEFRDRAGRRHSLSNWVPR